MITAMESCGHRPCSRGSGKPVGNAQHNRIAIRHHGNRHICFGIVAIGNLLIPGKRTATQKSTDAAQINEFMSYVQAHGRCLGVFNFLLVPLTIVKTNR